MNMQQAVQPRTSSNGYSRRRNDRDTGTKLGSGGVLEFASCDRLIYLTTCLIGHQVEVQVQDGSVFSGVFHATNAKDFAGVVLKMAYLIKDGSPGQKNISNSSTKLPSRTLIIPANDLVQVIAKDVTVTRDGFTNELQHVQAQELMTDSCISQSRHVELGRELELWVPDETDPGCPELENIFDCPWNRGWDQFEANEALFGVKSTFNEELYTTKLERGPKMSELERVALRIAREIEGEEAVDPHQAEERGIQIDGDLEIDEETRFSSVYRRVDDSGYEEIEEILLDSRNNETFGGVSSSVIDKTLKDTSNGTQVSSGSLMGKVQSSLTSTSRDEESKGKLEVYDQSQVSKAEDSHSLLRSKKESSDKVGLSPNATAFDPSHASSQIQEKTSSSSESEGATAAKTQGTASSLVRQIQEKTSSSSESEGATAAKTQGTAGSLVRPSSSASTASDRSGVASSSATRGLSPSSSAGSLSSEKSTLNPHAKEFKFNPSAKSFIPSQSTLRPSSPADSPFYYPANMTPAANMHGMPISIGIGPPFAAQQPVMFNPQAAPMPQPYYHPNGPQYGQQMMIGQSRPMLYMPTYSPEMPYRGREF